MKKIFATLFALLVISQFSYGQNTFPSNGNVGIGTTIPNAKLDVSIETNALSSATLQSWNWSPDKTNWGLKLNQYHTGSAIDQRFTQRIGTSDYEVLTFHLGNVGIGTTNPDSKLHVAGSIRADGGNVGIGNNRPTLIITDTEQGSNLKNWDIHTALGVINFRLANDAYNDARTWMAVNRSGFEPTSIIFPLGNIGIGTSSPDSKLTVKGKIHAQEVKIDMNILPDYVFDKTYKLLSLKQVEEYINEHHHLPEVPSAAEVEKEGLKLGEMNLILLKKIEELTLHLIEKDNQLKEQNTQLIEQNKKLNEQGIQLKKQQEDINLLKQYVKQ